MVLEDVVADLSQLPVNKRGKWVAPHKGVLLLAVMELVERGKITGDFVAIDDELVRTFRRIWSERVPAWMRYRCNLAYPFFHMRTASFWRLVMAPGFEWREEYGSVKVLQQSFEGALVSAPVMALMRASTARERLRRAVEAIWFAWDDSAAMAAEPLA